MTESGRYVQVALPIPTPTPYTYLLPPELDAQAGCGARVVVPVRERELVGVVVARDVGPPHQQARAVLAAPDPLPALTPELLKLAHWMAGYYGVPIGLALRCVLPGGMWGASRVVVRLTPGADEWKGRGKSAELVALLRRRGAVTTAHLKQRFKRAAYDVVTRLERAGVVQLEVESPRTGPAPRSERVVRLVGEPLSLQERDRRFRRAPAQRQAYEALEALDGSANLKHLSGHLGIGDGVVRRLVKDKLAEIERVSVLRDPFATAPTSPPPPKPTPDQERALQEIAEAPRERNMLLHGVTGSGKTLVYLELLRRDVEVGRGCIVLVPEISLTPQTVARVRGVFGGHVAVLHSALSDAERVEAWWQLRTGQRLVAIGARSAVFAPIPKLGTIVADEEHEGTYKHGEAPRYHARDVARVRARLENARLILGSATPALESWDAAVRGDAMRVSLPQRVDARRLPGVELVDLRSAELAVLGPVPWSVALDDAVGGALDRGEQALLLLNRRGFAAFLQCADCGAVRTCVNCSISLTVHRAPPALRCHYCGYEEPIPAACVQCDGAVEHMRGAGTQQLERFVAERFPTARLGRMDVDTTGSKWAHHRILERVERREVDVLLGTQMIAKGLDFPEVTVVGVVDADTALHLPDFRAAERTFQLVAQVAGRTGRGPKGGTVVVQTRNPEHPALRCAAMHDVEGFLARELEARAAPAYPPHVGLLRILVSGPDHTAVANRAGQVGDWVRALDARLLGNQLSVLGPALAPLARLKRRWRWHLVVKAAERRALGHVVRSWARRGAGGGGVQVILDRDPMSLL